MKVLQPLPQWLTAEAVQPFVDRILEQPEEWAHYAALADHAEEQGDEGLASTLRWMVENRKRPQCSWQNRFYWTTEGGLPDFLPHAGLCVDLCKVMGFREWLGCYDWLEAVRSLAEGLRMWRGLYGTPIEPNR